MVLMPVRCPPWQHDRVLQGGTPRAGQQRSRCHNADCSPYAVVLNPASPRHGIDTRALHPLVVLLPLFQTGHLLLHPAQETEGRQGDGP